MRFYQKPAGDCVVAASSIQLDPWQWQIVFLRTWGREADRPWNDPDAKRQLQDLWRASDHTLASAYVSALCHAEQYLINHPVEEDLGDQGDVS
jgi:hypothetical protein